MELIVSLLCLIAFVEASVNNELLARTNSSNLCSRKPSQSCLHQLQTSVAGVPTGTTETCQVEVANNTYHHRCDNHVWNHHEVCHAHDGCGVNLEVYRHIPLLSLPFYRIAFNLSLANITSREVRLRYRDTLTGNFTFCINFTTSSSAANPFESLWYDCVFHSRLHEGHSFQLEFQSHNKYGIFLFQVPTEKDVRNGQGFLYVHLHHSPHLLITFQDTSGIQLNKCYLVTVCKWVQNVCQVTLQHKVDLKNSSTFSQRFRDSVTVSMGKILFSGNFSVRIEEPNCTVETCYQATSSFFTVQDYDGNYIFFLLGMLGVLAFAAFCATMGCRKRIKMTFGGLNGLTTDIIRQKILLVYDPAASDYHFVEALQIFLQRWGGFDVLLDFIEIPRSPHKDPLIWYSEAMETADVVAVLAPPADGSVVSLNQRPAIYHHTFDLALELVSTRISRRLNLKERGVLQRFAVLQADESAVPEVCSSFARFVVPGQLPKFIRYVGRSQDRRDSDDSSNPKRQQGLADRLIERCSEEGESTVMDSFHMIYEHLRERNKSPDVHQARDSIVDDAKHVSERLSLLGSETENEERDQRREQLDREFGTAIPSVTALTTLG